MIKRAMIALAASAALVPATAMAQTVGDPDPSYGTPDIALAVAAAAAQSAGRMGPMRTGGPLRAGTPGRHNPGMRNPGMRNPGVRNPGMRHGGSNSYSNSRSNSVSNSSSNSVSNSYSNSVSHSGSHGGGWQHGGGSNHGGGWQHGGGSNHGGGWQHGGNSNRRHFRFNRIHRGGFVNRHFFGGQFVINNWSNFGFSAPPSGAFWIRYFDDALLIDRNGRVLDGRYDFDWDRHGGGWAYGEDGAPYRTDMDSEEWYEDEGEGYGRGGSGHHGDRVVRVERRDGRMGPPPGYHAPPMPMPPMPPMPGYGGYGHGYGYGYGYGGGLIIMTETTVHAAPVVETRTVYETVVERVRVKPRVRKPCNCSRPAPRPRPGERG